MITSKILNLISHLNKLKQPKRVENKSRKEINYKVMKKVNLMPILKAVKNKQIFWEGIS